MQIKCFLVISTSITTKELLYNLTYYFIRTFLNGCLSNSVDKKV